MAKKEDLIELHKTLQRASDLSTGKNEYEEATFPNETLARALAQVSVMIAKEDLTPTRSEKDDRALNLSTLLRRVFRWARTNPEMAVKKINDLEGRCQHLLEPVSPLRLDSSQIEDDEN